MWRIRVILLAKEIGAIKVLTAHLCTVVLSASVAAQDPAAASGPRWDMQLTEDEDQRLGRQLSTAIIGRNWLEGALLADGLDGVQFVPGYQALLYQMVGRADLVAELEQRGELSAREICPAAPDVRPALETILERAAHHRVVILNDSHNHAQSRVLLHQLLAPLKSMGFDYLAVEDFSGSVGAYAALAYPGEAAAWQSSREPIFADAIRRAIKLDYRLVPYEVDFQAYQGVADEDRLQYREDRQAQNLIDRILAGDPQARVLVYAGHQHVFEAIVEPISPTYKPMALRLRELSGIDPLTIDQTECWAVDDGETPGPIAFDASGDPITAGDAAGRVDLQVRHSPHRRGARPHWLEALGRTPVQYPDSLRTDLEPVVIEARLASEPEDAAPVDRLYLGAGEQFTLYLAPGAYTLRAQSRDGWSDPVPLTVE